MHLQSFDCFPLDLHVVICYKGGFTMPRKPNPAKRQGYNKPFPTALRNLMRERGETQEDIKGILGLANRQSVTGYVDGSTEPTPDKIIAVAKHYGVSADYLLGLGELADTTADSRAAAKYTGLSEKAVSALHLLSTANFGGMKAYSDMLSELIEDEGLFESIAECCSCIASARMLQMMLEEKPEGYESSLTRISDRAEVEQHKAIKLYEKAIDRIITNAVPFDETIKKARAEYERIGDETLDEFFQARLKAGEFDE